MSKRRVRDDKSGLYVLHDRRRFRPPSNSLIGKGDEVQTWGFTSNEQDSVRIIKYGAPYQVTQTLASGRHLAGTKRDKIADEVWATTEEHPQIRENLKDGQMNLLVRANGIKTTVVVGADGFDFRGYKRDPKRYQEDSTGMNILISNKMMMTWDEWDAFVAAVEGARTEVEIGPTVAKLQADLNAEDMIHEYIEKKGLAGG